MKMNKEEEEEEEPYGRCDQLERLFEARHGEGRRWLLLELAVHFHRPAERLRLVVHSQLSSL